MDSCGGVVVGGGGGGVAGGVGGGARNSSLPLLRCSISSQSQSLSKMATFTVRES
jgi:hypothetical protein